MDGFLQEDMPMARKLVKGSQTLSHRATLTGTREQEVRGLVVGVGELQCVPLLESGRKGWRVDPQESVD